MVAKNFYEKLDDIFNKLTEDNPEYFNKIIMQVKSDVISAYDYDNQHKSTYIKRMIKAKSFAITEDGKIVSV